MQLRQSNDFSTAHHATGGGTTQKRLGLLVKSLILSLGLASYSSTLFSDGLPDLTGATVIAGTASTIIEQEHPFAGLIDLDGQQLTAPPVIGQGQWTLVMIWATDCHICKVQKPLISQFHDAHKDLDANVFGIALDGRQGLNEVNQYLNDHVVSFPNFVGDYPSIAISYQKLTEESLLGTPTYLLFDPSGELKGNNPGPIGVEAIEKFIARHES